MRTAMLTAALFLSLSAAAQQQALNRLHLFVANPSLGYSEGSGSNWNAGVGFAYQRAISPRWGVELAVMRERQQSRIYVSDINGNFVTTTRTYYETPVDVAALYHFNNESSWRPYIGPAVRWMDTRELGESKSFLYGAETGVLWQIGTHVGLRFDGKFLVGDTPRWSNRVNGSIGVSWRF